ncbi:MAG: leucine-rich repeat domain-containing protein [Firmicutes bacterium]|nr:leucine-rich repeat domain-containing protein [Bacillota bacterium]
MKRALTVTLILMMLVTFAACDTGTSGSRKASPASDFDYWISENRDRVVILRYIGTAADVVIPETIENIPVERIYSYAFSYTNIKSIDIPDSVVSIMTCAFDHCTELETVKFGANIEQIGSNAFEKCTALKEAYLPGGLKLLGNCAFSGCASLETVFMPASLTTQDQSTNIWSDTFAYNTSLKNIIFEEGTETIGGGFVSCTSLQKVTVPASVKKVLVPAFSKCENLTEIVFEGDAPEFFGMHTHGDFAFGIYDSGYKGNEYRNIKVYYHPDKAGWDTTVLKGKYNLIPIEE